MKIEDIMQAAPAAWEHLPAKPGTDGKRGAGEQYRATFGKVVVSLYPNADGSVGLGIPKGSRMQSDWDAALPVITALVATGMLKVPAPEQSGPVLPDGGPVLPDDGPVRTVPVPQTYDVGTTFPSDDGVGTWKVVERGTAGLFLD